MTFLITGATGFIGGRLVRQLLADGHAVHYLARKRSEKFDPSVVFHEWDIHNEAPLGDVPRVDAVIHLTGEPVAQRWTDDTKRRIRESRVRSTRNLVAAFGKLSARPEVMVSASAIGFYGDRGEETLTEQSAAGKDFLSTVCVEWEREAQKARQLGLRVVPVRFATVLGRESGAFPLMARPARFGLGAKFGDGKQWMSWIHVQDLVKLLIFAATNKSVADVLNGASPEPVRNGEFTKALGAALHKPAVFSVPRFALRLGLGEMSEMLLGSQRVLPEAALAAGFTYQFGRLSQALGELVSQPA